MSSWPQISASPRYQAPRQPAWMNPAAGPYPPRRRRWFEARSDESGGQARASCPSHEPVKAWCSYAEGGSPVARSRDAVELCAALLDGVDDGVAEDPEPGRPAWVVVPTVQTSKLGTGFVRRPMCPSSMKRGRNVKPTCVRRSSAESPRRGSRLLCSTAEHDWAALARLQ